MKRTELRVGDVVAYKSSKHRPSKAAVVMSTEPVDWIGSRLHGERKIVPVEWAYAARNVHVVILSNGWDGRSEDVQTHEELAPLNQLKGDYLEVLAAEEQAAIAQKAQWAREREERDARIRRANAMRAELRDLGIEVRDSPYDSDIDLTLDQFEVLLAQVKR